MTPQPPATFAAGAALGRAAPGAASLLLAAAAGFGASRDFGMFLLGLLVLPMLALFAGASIVAAALAGGARRSVPVACAVALLSVPAYPAAAALRDPVRFLGWAIAHAPVGRFERRDGVVAAWDSWGMAGSGNDSYLVVSTRAALTDAAAADRWRRRQGLGCAIVAARRMWRPFWIVTTFNCPFGFDGQRWS